jgi:hypothetical protein
MITNNGVGLTKSLHSRIGVVQIIRHFGVLWNSSEHNGYSTESQKVTSNKPYCSFHHISGEDSEYHQFLLINQRSRLT